MLIIRINPWHREQVRGPTSLEDSVMKGVDILLDSVNRRVEVEILSYAA